MKFRARRFSVVATAVVSASSSRMSDGVGELVLERSGELCQLIVGEALVEDCIRGGSSSAFENWVGQCDA